MKPIEVWLTLGSTYTYLTVHRLAQSADAGVPVTLRAMYLGRIFHEIGVWPFPPERAKTLYMWRDLARRADEMGLSPVLPAPYPAPQTERANRVFHVVNAQGRGLEFLLASYEAWFGQGLMPGEDAHLERVLGAMGLDVAQEIAMAESDEVDAALVAATEEAKARGIFGAPSFIVEDELFWGDDRFQSALDWAARG